MKPTLNIRFTVLAAALLLAACGGSSGPSSESALGSNNNSMSAPIVQVESPADPGANANSIGELNTSEGSVIASPVAEENVESNDPQSTGAVLPDTIESAIEADNVVVSAETYPNSFCVEPGAMSVSYEDYYSSRNRRQQGVYVPFPSSGFGWDGSKLCDLEGSRELDEIELLVPYVAQRPDTDGVIAEGEWLKAANAGTYNYETRGNDIDNLLVATVADYQDGAGYSEWWAMHDGTNLYLRIRVTNDRITTLLSDSAEPWNDDSVELYFDGDNSKGESFDGVNDFQALLVADNETLPVIAPSSASGLAIFHRSGGQYSFDIEVTITLESAGIEIGRPFGFDVHINEDDNGGERDAKWGWFEKTGFDRSWYEPSRFGTLLLTDCEDRNSCGSYQTLSP